MIRRLLDDWRLRRRDRAIARWIVETTDAGSKSSGGAGEGPPRDEGQEAIFVAARNRFSTSGDELRGIYGTRAQRLAQGRQQRQTSSHAVQRAVAIGCALLLGTVGIKIALDLLAGRAPLLSQSIAQDYVAKTGEIRTITLSDGSRVTLDTDSRLTVIFTPKARELRLERGRARFELTAVPSRPATVRAGSIVVTSLGTRFDIDLDHMVRVHPLSGWVQIQAPHIVDGKSMSRERLDAGQEMLFDPIVPQAIGSPSPAAPSEEQWVTGMKTFDEVPLRQVVDELGRYSAAKIELADPAIGDLRPFLDLDLRDVRGSLQTIVDQLHLKLDDSRPGYFILTRP